MSARYKKYPRLWQSPEEDTVTPTPTTIPPGFSTDGSTASFVRSRMVPSTDLVSLKVQRPQSRPLSEIMNNSLVVGQEFALTCLFLARHRAITLVDSSSSDDERENKNVTNGECRQVMSMGAVAFVVMMILYYSESDRSSSERGMNGKKKRLLVRATDAILLAAILRFLSSVLQTLTASYSSDTVNALAIGGMVIHLLACDYSYALGISKKKILEESSSRRQVGRPTFLGGTVSLNAALFSTTLLASRLPTNVISYAFISSAVILFAFYPAARHAIAKKSQSPILSPCQVVTVATASATVPLLINVLERIAFLTTLGCLCLVSPVVRWWLQRHKGIICGPWDIAHIAVEE